MAANKSIKVTWQMIMAGARELEKRIPEEGHPIGPTEEVVEHVLRAVFSNRLGIRHRAKENQI